MSGELFLECKIGEGQFSGEFAIRGVMASGQEFSLFSGEDDVEFRQSLTQGSVVRGWLKVEPLEQKGDLVLVALPQSTIDGEKTVTVLGKSLRNMRGGLVVNGASEAAT